jgi:hypothetical protein
MAAHLHADEDDEPTLPFLLVDSLAFLVRNRLVFWIAALPIAGLAFALTYVLDANQKFIDYRDHWAWDFLFALIYAMFLDRWIKETLLDGASDCDEVDNLRRSVIAVRFLAIAALMFVLAMALSLLRIEGTVEMLEGWHLPHGVALVAGLTLAWLPHVLVWALVLSYFAPMLPAMSAAEPAGGHRGGRGQIFKLVFGLAVAALVAYSATRWGLEALPKRSWSEAAMAAAWRFFDCLLLALGGHVLATIWWRHADWHQPEPDDHPYRDFHPAGGKRARRA